MEKQKNNEEKQNRVYYKFVLIGDSSTNKTSFFKKITSDIFCSKNISTIGVDKKIIRFENLEVVSPEGEKSTKNFNIDIWDTAGQERYRSLTKSYYMNSDSFLLFYDITNRESFNYIQSWISSIEEERGPIQEKIKEFRIVLLGNNLNLVESNSSLRNVSTEEALALCEKQNLIWGGEISSKNMSQNELLLIVKDITKRTYNSIGNLIKKKQIAKKIKTTKTRKNCNIY